MASTYPQLLMHADSGLNFPWSEYHPDPVKGSFSASLAPDGVTVGMKMLINWTDLNQACQELLGYSWRDDGSSTAILRRKLPWQNPKWNQLYVRRIADVHGIQMIGHTETNSQRTSSGGASLTTLRTPPPGFVGDGYHPNMGPRTEYTLAELDIQFWRPPYYIRTDSDIGVDALGRPQEWLRYVSKSWEMSLNMLSRENSTFQWLPAQQPGGSSKYFTGAVGQTLTHFRVTRTWYQIPEQALFATLVDRTPNGLPTNMVYTQTPTENPISKFDRAAGTSTTAPSAAALQTATGYIYPAGSPIGGCVNAPVGGAAVDAAGTWVDLTQASRFFGCYSGTLRFDGVTFTPQPLQLPPALMDILSFGSGNEAISQQQYDVTFHFDLFDPPPGTTYGPPIKGHNIFPFSGNGLWYPLVSQKDANNGLTGPKLTPMHYADFSDLFQIL